MSCHSFTPNKQNVCTNTVRDVSSSCKSTMYIKDRFKFHSRAHILRRDTFVWALTCRPGLWLRRLLVKTTIIWLHSGARGGGTGSDRWGWTGGRITKKWCRFRAGSFSIWFLEWKDVKNPELYKLYVHPYELYLNYMLLPAGEFCSGIEQREQATGTECGTVAESIGMSGSKVPRVASFGCWFTWVSLSSKRKSEGFFHISRMHIH